MKEVKKFLKNNPPIQVEVLGTHGKREHCYLLRGRLAILGPKKDILYTLSYVSDHNASRYIPNQHVSFMEELFKIDETVEYILEPVRFMQELEYTSEVKEEMFTIEIDGEEVYRNATSYKCDRARDSYLKERKKGNVDFKHMKITNPKGERTDFTF